MMTPVVVAVLLLLTSCSTDTSGVTVPDEGGVATPPTTSAPGAGSPTSPTASDAADDPIEGARQFFPEAQPDEFTDGQVTFEEYQAAALTYRECLSRAGVGIGRFDLDPETKVYSVLLDRDPEADPATSGCYRPFGPIDAAWQLTVDQSRRALGLDDSTERLRSCLTQWSIEWDEGMHDGQLAILLLDNGVDPLDCQRQ